ncbi:hypothetical protein [Halopseudomonas salina]|uniref:DUF4153 domain-containing protein n=1 Tax=Halopseudomonas salina TaxID=1323744 RepID=A0ABQ1PYI4_9GAMM|nr:hypothetical protein [Halopseudomonas salina]GGD07652.1 DUF4153 domain-containing protein [Halopseudomonas salina]
MQDNPVIRDLGEPETLESLYRAEPARFRKWLDEAIFHQPASETLRVWEARLSFAEHAPSADAFGTKLFVIVVALIAGTLVKLHALPFVEDEWYLPRFVPLIVIGTLIVYFLATSARSSSRMSLSGLAACVALAALLPSAEGSDTVTMAFIHLPLVVLSVLALAFMGDDWRSSWSRSLYVRYLGEMLIYTAIILLGGIVLTLLTFGLFQLININIDEWYAKYVVVYGLVASPLVATYLYDVPLNRDSRIATLIANLFAPLILLTIGIYLLAILLQGTTPYSDRDFLITINGLLLVVLAIVIYSVTGKITESGSRSSDMINMIMITLTLVIDAFALSAIVFRWAEFGITPNRVAVTGVNLLVFIHLLILLKDYLAYKKLRVTSEALVESVTGYLAVYTGWSVFVVIGLPLLFWFS